MNQFLRTLYLAPLSFLLTGCWTSIFTVAPTVEPVAPVKTVYTTTVTTPAPKHTTVNTVTVTSYNSDPCFSLDLNAVAAAFAESRSVREFEQILNSGRYMINNLDLNRDGWIDYLRVIETHSGYYHTMLIQACLAPGVFQDVATLIAERRTNALYVEVVGDRYLYGYNYIVRPVFVKRPPLWDVFGRPTYAVWTSPYYYGYFPSYYTQPKPVYQNHYQAYVTTYMSNHHYCHSCEYPTTVFYSNYTNMTRSASRSDYAAQHPSDSFEQRVTRTASSTNGVSVRNAGQLRHEVNKAAAKAETKTGTSGKTSSTSSTSSTGTTRSSSSSSSSNSSRSAVTATSTTKTGGTSARSSGTTATTRQSAPSTTIQTKVNKSGTTRTTVKTTDASGRTTTVKRESSSTRSGSSSTRSGSSSATRSSGSSVRSSQGSTSGSSPRSSQRGR